MYNWLEGRSKPRVIFHSKIFIIAKLQKINNFGTDFIIIITKIHCRARPRHSPQLIRSFFTIVEFHVRWLLWLYDFPKVDSPNGRFPENFGRNYHNVGQDFRENVHSGNRHSEYGKFSFYKLENFFSFFIINEQIGIFFHFL
jgi:hypothetical protein